MNSSSDPLWAFGAEFVASFDRRPDPDEDWAGEGFDRRNEESAS